MANAIEKTKAGMGVDAKVNIVIKVDVTEKSHLSKEVKKVRGGGSMYVPGDRATRQREQRVLRSGGRLAPGRSEAGTHNVQVGHK